MLAELRGEGPIFGDVRLRLVASYPRASGDESGPNDGLSPLGAFLIVPIR